MNKWMKWTAYFCLFLVVIIVVWDFVAIDQGGKEASISYTIINWSYEYPSITFLLGFVCGHLFWRMREAPKTLKKGE